MGQIIPHPAACDAWVVELDNGMLVAMNPHAAPHDPDRGTGWRMWVWTHSVEYAEKWLTRAGAELFASNWIRGGYTVRPAMPQLAANGAA